jgi:hypothetical protein
VKEYPYLALEGNMRREKRKLMKTWWERKNIQL